MAKSAKVSGGRNSAIELLRILAMLMIIASHIRLNVPGVTNSERVDTLSLTGESYAMVFLHSMGQVGVAIFFLIMGYFLFKCKSTSPKRILKITLPTWFWSITMLLVATVAAAKIGGVLDFSLVDWRTFTLRSIFPIIFGQYWFVTAYIILWLLAPYLKKWFDTLRRGEIIRLILIVLGLNFIPMTVGLLLNDGIPALAGGYFNGVPTTYASSVLTWILFVLVGYSVHRFYDDIKKISCVWLVLFVSLATFVIKPVLQYILFNFVGLDSGSATGTSGTDYFSTQTSMPVFSLSVSLLIVALMRPFRVGFINYIGSLTFGIYLIHENIFVRNIFWPQVSSYLEHYPMNTLLFGILATLAFFTVCAILEAIRMVSISIASWFLRRIKLDS